MDWMGHPLVRAIVENLDDDAPRLVFADWLDEHDHASWAELIRVQCRIAGLDEAAVEVPVLRSREQQLLRGAHRPWEATMPRLDGLAWNSRHRQSTGFERGFPEWATWGSLRNWQAQLSRFWEETTINRLAIQLEPSRSVAEVFRLITGSDPRINRLRELDFRLTSGRMEHWVLDAMSEFGVLNQLEGLSITADGVNWDGLSRYLQSHSGVGLVGLSLKLREIAPSLLRVLGDPKRPEPWLLLRLDGRTDSPWELATLLHSPSVEGIHTLELSQEHVHPMILAALIESPRLARLEQLRVASDYWDLPSLRRLVASGMVRMVRHLQLRFHERSSEAVAALAQVTGQTRWLSLRLELGPMGDQAWRMIEESPAFANLRSLQIRTESPEPEREATLRNRFGNRLRWSVVQSRSA
ncbi:TIGR02996 domain-containing protein [Tuwongella immobilis]|uniref:Repeat-companion domain protein n=1 Tax=Tuwongella immobilis TaxID=692036 RepID=A0A6C2YLV8_9BACT|nr:TIGR02996 domain-containing protein [Tuwongella immobilis]VIP02347.1 Repeat-companion domain protein OS=Isosphaera pallida (strain ATCC 43644 / DSM 9630 / IS1B) GN=Isop_0392 PE=4 SV=1 [Tuwongella immobilis]VTS01127.1 Repeat-companion domain protein OS=Isosphaera pallida (strain ATCC 43644 / DSM 9630 / IS1B) GN=Isop_0392 PE=4 SV=1 [Tuwongella immobilis]